MGACQLDLIDLDQPLPGQREFISCWVCRSPEKTFIVDPGPSSTAAELIARLHALGVEHLDWILLTHIHLDHAGGTAEVLDAFPGARVVCHHKGGRHLVEPQHLWEGSLAVLGQAAEVYGQPSPLAAEVLDKPRVLATVGIQGVQTPGHAAHHLCYIHDGTLFAGEVAGLFVAITDTDFYLRPATPPRFHFEVALASLDRLLAVDPTFKQIAFGHHGLFSGDCRQLLRIARDQLLIWVETVRAVLTEAGLLNSPESPSSIIDDSLFASVRERLLTVDPHYANLERLPADIQEREGHFTRQTLLGIFGYLDPRLLAG